MQISDELRDAIQGTRDLTVRLYDAKNDVAYVLIPEAVYERLCTASDEHLIHESQYAHVAKLLGPDGLGFGDDETVT